MKKEILVNLPGFWQEYKISLAMIDLKKKYPYLFKDDIVFNTVYDSFPCIWTAGRSAPRNVSHTKDMIAQKIVPFLERGIGLRYNFTNILLEEHHLYDENSNNIMKYTMEILKDYPNAKLGITIYSDLLKDYLDKNYPNLYYIWSTTMGMIGLDEINRRTEKDLLVLDFNYNNDFIFLKQLTHPEHIEILMNEGCIPFCPYRDIHWRMVSQAQLTDIRINTPVGCINKVMKTKYGSKSKAKIVTVEQIKENYLPLNINKIKLVGRREEDVSLISQYIYNFIKPDYAKEVKDYFMEKYIQPKYNKILV